MVRRCDNAKSRSARGAIVLAGVIVAQAHAGENAEHRVYRAPDTVGFERHCADAERHSVSAWTELGSGDGSARALALAYARRDPVRRDDVFVGLRLAALRTDAGHEAGGAHWSIRMEARNGDKTVTGEKHAGYDSNPARNEAEHRAFRADDAGRLDWLDFAEPGEEDDGGGYPRNWSPEMEASGAELGLSGDARDIALDLVLERLDSGEAVRLRGPGLRIPDRILQGQGPEPKTLGLLGTLNPFEKGSVWQWLGHGARYGRCVEERRSAKRAFTGRP